MVMIEIIAGWMSNSFTIPRPGLIVTSSCSIMLGATRHLLFMSFYFMAYLFIYLCNFICKAYQLLFWKYGFQWWDNFYISWDDFSLQYWKLSNIHIRNSTSCVWSFEERILVIHVQLITAEEVSFQLSVIISTTWSATEVLAGYKNYCFICTTSCLKKIHCTFIYD